MFGVGGYWQNTHKGPLIPSNTYTYICKTDTQTDLRYIVLRKHYWCKMSNNCKVSKDVISTLLVPCGQIIVCACYIWQRGVYEGGIAALIWSSHQIASVFLIWQPPQNPLDKLITFRGVESGGGRGGHAYKLNPPLFSGCRWILNNKNQKQWTQLKIEP